MSEAIITTIDDEGVATITLNRPKVHNAFDDNLINDLNEQLAALEDNLDAGFVVLAANGDSFSAGADINWMQRMTEYSERENIKDARRLAELMRRLHDFRKPTIAKVQGAAFGGGVGLVACCDIAIASEKASFCLSEVKLGLIPAVVSPYVVKAIGERQARRYFITAERFDAREAQRIGLVHRVVAAEALDDWTAKMIGTLSANGPNAMSACKDLIRTVSRGPIDAGMIEETARRIAAIRVSDEGQEGLNAFLHKRKPDWCETADF
jgi:methylglutaconyl-CoA hydratase